MPRLEGCRVDEVIRHKDIYRVLVLRPNSHHDLVSQKSNFKMRSII